MHIPLPRSIELKFTAFRKQHYWNHGNEAASQKQENPKDGSEARRTALKFFAGMAIGYLFA